MGEPKKSSDNIDEKPKTELPGPSEEHIEDEKLSIIIQKRILRNRP
jgi:hypothetical protein